MFIHFLFLFIGGKVDLKPLIAVLGREVVEEVKNVII
jgi:hypothetical protein